MPRLLTSLFFALLIVSVVGSDSHAQLAQEPVLYGDVNLDGVHDFGDIPAFIAVLQSGVFQAEADVNFDGVVNFSDIPHFFPPFFVGQ